MKELAKSVKNIYFQNLAQKTMCFDKKKKLDLGLSNILTFSDKIKFSDILHVYVWRTNDRFRRMTSHNFISSHFQTKNL